MTNTLKNIDVFILCGGLGKRLRKFSSGKPKPIVDINGRGFLDIVLEYMAGFGFRNFILGIGYKARLIRKHYKPHIFPGLKIVFSEEKSPLGTGGAVKHARKFIHSNPFMVLNGDSFCKFDPKKLLEFHKSKKAMFSMLLVKSKDAADYGSVKIGKDRRMLGFSEKNVSAKNCLVNAGAYVFDKSIFSIMPNKKSFSIEKDFFHKLCKKRCFGYISSGFFIDIGIPKRLLEAKEYFINNNDVRI